MSVAADSFVAKWAAREPALRLLPAFLPTAQRDRVPLWLCLLNELDSAMFDSSDPAVSQTKLAWWGEELAQANQARHPLARALAHQLQEPPEPALWRRLARAAIELSAHESAPSDWAASDARWRPLAEAVAELEARLFASQLAADGIAGHWRLARSLQTAAQPSLGSSVPLAFQARYAVAAGHALPTAAWQALGETLLPKPEAMVGACLHRQVQQRELARQLNALGSGTAPAQALQLPPWRLLWLCWRSARAASRGGTDRSHMRS